MLKRKTVKIGDIFQIQTKDGICYGQVINTHKDYKFIVAIFREFFSKQPESFQELTSISPQLITPFLIQNAVNEGLFSLVSNERVAKPLKKFPIFRDTNNLRKEGRTLWWFWDGTKEWKVDRKLTDEEKKYPSCSLPSAPLLIEWIQNDYRVERDYI